LIQLDACTLAADEQQWKSALQHLLANARFALAVGGRLEITLTRVTLDSATRDELGLVETDCCQLIVRDSGFGMKPEIARRAFEPFFTTRAEIKAPGLGLTIVHSVAQVHGGQVLLQTAEDKGTTVTIFLPVAVAATAEKPGPAAKKTSKSQPVGKALLVERDPLAREVLRSWLQQRQFAVHVAENENEALQIYQRYANDWKLLVVEAASAEAARVFQNLRAANQDIPAILLLNAKPCPENILHGPNPPVVLQKPFTYRAFRETVERQLQPDEG
jgi:CheY-like chemotaxis protein